jgi:hypothetical protein
MSHLSTARKFGLLGAATALSAAGFLQNPAPAVARPPMPLSPVCDQFQFIGDYSLRQSNGFTVIFRSTGPVASGSASALDSSGKTALTGTVNGSITGTHLDFTTHWSSGAQGHYTGIINGDGFASGTTTDAAHPGAITNWGGTVPLGCATPTPPGPRPGRDNPPIAAPDGPAKGAPPQQPPAAPVPPQAQPATVTVAADVDVYNIPDGDHGKKLGILRKGSQVQVLDRKNGFAHVKGNAVPTGIGYAWGDFIPSA